PALPLAIYLGCRLPPVHAAVSARSQLLARTVTATIFFGGVALLLGYPLIDPAVGEAVQLHGLIGLGAAVGLGAVAVSWPLHRRADALAVALGLTAGVTLLFLLSAAFWQFRYGPFALDVARLVAEALPVIG
ncbi:MAG: hypothetical protein ABEH64_08005, partial [Salinirussus sp.]